MKTHKGVPRTFSLLYLSITALGAALTIAWVYPGYRPYFIGGVVGFWLGGVGIVHNKRQQVHSWWRSEQWKLYWYWWKDQEVTRAVAAKVGEQLVALWLVAAYLTAGIDSPWHIVGLAAFVVVEAAMVQKQFWLVAAPFIAWGSIATVSSWSWELLPMGLLWVYGGCFFLITLVIGGTYGNKAYHSLKFRKELRKRAKAPLRR
jgi:hypothetical protein